MENNNVVEVLRDALQNPNFVAEAESDGAIRFSKEFEQSLKKACLALESNFVLETMSQEKIKFWIKECEGKHKQQVAYSSYHNALTQVCFDCKKIRTNGDFK